MRNLTIKRNKTFVASLAKMKVYIEDPTAAEITINQVPCRKLGELKNGEEKTFQIGEQSARVYVIADQLTKNYCNEYYQLPEGQEDISLSGKNKYNPVGGNPFRFDNNQSAGVTENRKRGLKVGAIVLVAAAVVGLAVGFGVGRGVFAALMKPQTKVFTSEGMSITLTSAFRESEVSDHSAYTAIYESRDVAVFALQKKFADYPELEDCTLAEYAQLLVEDYEFLGAKVKTGDGLTWFYFTSTDSGNTTFCYYSYVYRAGDAFWWITFTVKSEEVAESMEQQIITWAKSVKFAD